ncbi:NAD(P)H-dependent glycerol-3-phosphate dehydrogenase [Kordiimonas sp. SCSIO 12610]|uniref:NAD(P)H-dependent glycerol-3-phosphate dehydrogenase n=1 Tax=Kordiimonas sp. SCSIO 12610 TaxID=2829597 RepID=UPI00210CFFB4|nr:NAD(P)H-dependent glycerol-3-phosphate dehydrogenase [Kordiimonas sp. SCSIO 12610]UTW55299.1 NAD(P)-dependent glycerol-3-phosphate dehydrogenase [Kordiimonas sp. SCSIO 12610]
MKLGVLGGGAWGTALACASVRAGLETFIWAREAEVVASINSDHENSMFLSGTALPEALKATADLGEFQGADIILLVTPAQHLRSMAEALKEHIQDTTRLVICSKGIEISTGKLLSDVLAEIFPENPVAVLSGPTFAVEVARGQPCALTLAGSDEKIISEIASAIATPTFRPYQSHDIIGAQIGGAIKNVLAIATGIVSGLDLGENARAAVITRGLAEMARFGDVFGADQETMMGLSGLGDLILTCSSTQSRNMSLGKAIGEGQTFSSLMSGRKSVAEGAHTVEIVHQIAIDKGIEMPITAAVYKILKEDMDVTVVMNDLLSRPITLE